MFRKELGMAYCGLVCALCSENANCKGCRKGGCVDKQTCMNYLCCKKKDIASCSECVDFPCQSKMFEKPRIKAFCEFRKRYGEEELLECVYCNEKHGIQYHYPNEIIGDYDKLDEEEIIHMLMHGRDI